MSSIRPVNLQIPEFHLPVEDAKPSITRKTDKGLPTYDDHTDSDVFIVKQTDWTWFTIGVLIAFLPSVVNYFLALGYWFLPLNLVFILLGMYVSLNKAFLVKATSSSYELEPVLVEQAPTSTLFARRPDIQHQPLSCENTESEIPYIDLVSEETITKAGVTKEVRTLEVSVPQASQQSTTKSCHKCGTKIPSDSVFCKKCGTKQSP